MKKSFDSCVASLKKCDTSTVQEIRKLVASGSLLDSTEYGSKLIAKLGTSICEAVKFAALDNANKWDDIIAVLAALGDCSQGIYQHY